MIKFIILASNPFCITLQEEEEDGDLSSELTDLKSNAQIQTVGPAENSESDVEESQEKLTRELRLSSARAASM